MLGIKKSKEPSVDYLEVSKVEILQENVRNHEDDMCNNVCFHI